MKRKWGLKACILFSREILLSSELPYWETINNYLKRFSSDELQKVVCQLVRDLIRSRAFEGAKIRGKYWQVIIDGTQLHRSRRELDEHSLFQRHKKGTGIRDAAGEGKEPVKPWIEDLERAGTRLK